MSYSILFFFSLSLVFLLQAFPSPLLAQLRDYLKPAIDKQDDHQLAGIDFIYMINLDKRPEKFAYCAQQLAIYNIHPYRFSAVNGWELDFETLNAIGVHYQPWMRKNFRATCYLPENKKAPQYEIMQTIHRSYFCDHMPLGSIGIVLSHLSVLQDAYDSGYETIWVMEDDIEILDDPRKISAYIEKLDALVGKEHWDILFTDPDTKGQDGNYVICLSYAPRPNFIPTNPLRFADRHLLSAEFRSVGARYGSYSMILRRSGIKKILDFFNEYSVFLPYDMEFYLPKDMHLVTLTYDLVSTQSQALSDNRAPGYKN